MYRYPLLVYELHSHLLSYGTFLYIKKSGTGASDAEPEPPGAASFKADPEQIFWLVGAESQSPFFWRLRLQLDLLGKQKREVLLL